MKWAYVGAFLTVIFIALWMTVSLLGGAQAFQFTHSTGEDFNSGERVFDHTMLENDTVILENETTTTYYTTGTYRRDLSAGKVVNWTGIDWSGTIGPGQNITMRVETAPTPACSFAGNWHYFNNSPAAMDIELGYCLRYKAVLETDDNATTPVLDQVTLTYELVYPTVILTSPANGAVSDTGNATFECSAVSPNGIINITLFYNAGGVWHANESQLTSGAAVFDRTDIPDGVVIWNCLATDQAGLSAFAPENRTLIVGVVDFDPPNITHSISPKTVQVGGNVTISVTAVDDTEVDQVWAEITLPNTSVEILPLVNEDSVDYTTNQTGDYAIKIYANDTLGNEDYVSDSFTATTEAPPPPPPGPPGPGGPGGAPPTNVSFNVSAVDSDDDPVEFTLTIYGAGSTTEEYTFDSANGSVSEEILSGYYDLEFESWEGTLVVKLEGVTLYSDSDEIIGLDKPAIPASGYIMTYAVDNPYSVDGAEIQMIYLESLFPGEAGMVVDVCTNWDFENQVCYGNWTTENATQDTSADTMEVSLTDLGSYALSMRQLGYCGDGVCGADEDITTCPSDCECTTGESRTCGTSDTPPCSLGTQSCTDGQWGPCIGAIDPGQEICNEIDDDCDGTIDNLFGATTAEDTGCQCADGADPLDEEECNNIDDDCNGQIDEGLQRECGTDVGVCEFGLSTCTGGAWGPCIGGIEAQDEVCGNNLDDDCDGGVDEGCPPLAALPAAPEDGGPWNIIFYIMIIALVGLVAFILYRRMKGKAVSWKELEERYGGGGGYHLTWKDLEDRYR